MVNIQMNIERRKEKRYKAQEGAYVRMGALEDIVGEVYDISRSGLSFLYIGDEDVDISVDELKLDLFFTGKGYYLKKLPVKVVADFLLTSTSPFVTLPMRRWGVQFKKALPKEQELNLNRFISDHTFKLSS